MKSMWWIAAAAAAYFLIIKRGPKPGQMQSPLSIQQFQTEQNMARLDQAML